MNLGYIELGGGGVTARIYYDTAWLDTDPTRNPDDAPLINGPRGKCLDLTNDTGAKQTLTVNAAGATPTVVAISQGSPAKESRTAAQMASAGYTTRGNVGTVSIG